VTTAAVSAVTTAAGTVVMLALAGLLVGREVRRQSGRVPGRRSALAAAAMVVVLGADVAFRFVSLAHGH
jgi:hypothetical protein